LGRDFGPLLCEGERIERAYKLVRDKWVFTNKRLILQNVQGVTGKKVEYHTIPYRSIVHYSIENAGTFDMDAELKLWVRGFDGPIVQNFSKNSNLRELQQVLANYVL
ncbi:PH domain-containing protein, partial [Porphyromonas levii]|uniref:PH domain-containing protein n=1 Tax=Porphyromonas levii TaxID=28114 RepID=UPI001BA720D9